MVYKSFLLLLAAFLVSASLGAEPDKAPAISADRIKADVAYLASERLEGRGPGTRGEELATEYLADEFKKAGLKPMGQRGTYFQPVPLLRVVTSPKATLRAVKGDTKLDIPCEEGFSGLSHTQAELEEFDAEAIFLGHGITAPEFEWDDYKGVDVKGKVVVLFTNEPPSDDPKFFAGTALTYYGRWTYKFEEATRRGAKACFIIHTRETAGYPYSVVRPLDGAQLKRESDKPALAFAGWLSREAGEKLLNLSGHTVEEALKEADTKGFKAYSLGVNLTGNIQTRVEKIVTNNVVGMVEGSDPTLKAEAVVFTAHWDHLGVGRAVLGDSVYHGAADNATGCALLMELARAWSAQTPKPKRSAIFLAVTAEEKGLLGSKYYTQNPLVPLGKTALNLNFDMILPLGVPESVVVTGADRTTAWPSVKAAAEKNHLEIEVDQRAHLGIFYRSDHFSMAQAGVPAFSVAPGMKIKDKPKEFAPKAMQEFNDKAYHTPQDVMKSDWDFSGFVVLAQFALDVAREIANADRLPTWNAGDEFLPAREKSGPWQTQTVDTKADFRGLCVVSPKVAWVSGTQGTYARTTDAGKTWSVATVPAAEKLDFRAVKAFGESTAYLLSAGPGDASRIYKTIDGGKSWSMQFKNADAAAFFDAIAFWDEKNGIVLGDPVKGLFQLLVTSDGGENWKPLAAKELPQALPGEAAFAASGTCLVVQGDNDVWFTTGGAKTARVFHSKDRGQNWEVSETPLVAGIESAGIFSLAFRDKQHGLIVGGDYRKPNDSGATAAITADGGKTWTPLNKRLPFRSAVAWAKDRWVVVGTSGSHFSQDDGDTWKSLDRENYNSVGFTATGEGWAVGPKGRIAMFAK